MTTSTWLGGSGSWTTALQWSNGTPGAADTALFPTGGTYAVTFDTTATVAVLDGFDTTATFDFTGGMLTLAQGSTWAGTLDLSGNADLVLQSGFSLGNSLEITSGTTVENNGGFLGSPSPNVGVTVDAGGLFESFGFYEDPLVDNGLVQVAQGQELQLYGALSGNGTLQIANNATLGLGNTGAGLTVDFAAAVASPGTLTNGDESGDFTGPTLDNIGFGDTIVFNLYGGTTPEYTLSGSTLTITDGVNTATFDVGATPPTGVEFVVTASTDGLVAIATDNVPPVITVPGLVMDVGGGKTPIAGISVIDTDLTYKQITVTVDLSGSGSLGMNETATGGSATATGATLTITGTQSNIDSDLATLNYAPASATTQLSTITVSAHNNGLPGPDGTNVGVPQSFHVVTVPADASTWTAVAIGNWNTGATWASGVAPGVGGDTDDFVVGSTNDVTVSDAEGANSLAIVSSGAGVDISGGSLTLTGSASAIVLAAGVLTMNGGTIDGNAGTIDIDGGSVAAFSGVLDNVAIRGALAVAGTLSIEDGFSIAPAAGTGPGSIDVSSTGGINAEIYFVGSYTLHDTDITLSSIYPYDAVLSGDALTLDSQTTVTAANGAAIGSGPFASPSSVTNDGTILVTGTAQEQATTFDNAGSVIVNGGSLEVSSGTFDNATSVTIENAGTLFIANAAALIGGGSVYMSTGGVVTVATPVLTGAGFYFTDPATLILDDPSTFDGTIGGLGSGDVIELTGKTITAGSITGTTLTLDLQGDGTQTLHVAPGETGLSFFATASGGLEVACFAAGTRILTDRAAVPVEALREGDAVVSAFGTIRPVRWIGHRRIDCVRHARPHEVWPVRIAAGAFGAGLPQRDLWLSPDHAVFVEDFLMPVKCLTNGSTITQVPVDRISYYHVELPRHDVLLAEGLPVESYLDTGNRSNFSNDGGAVRLHSDFSALSWEVLGCAPLIVTGPRLDAVRARLAAIAATMDAGQRRNWSDKAQQEA